MSSLRICACYPSDKELDHPSLKILNFIVNQVFVLPNISNAMHREDHTKDCFDQMAGNETDLIPNWGSLTSVYENAGFFTVADQSSSVIISAYDPVLETSGTDVLSTLSSYSVGVYFSVVSVFLASFLFLRLYAFLMRKKRRRKTRRSIGSTARPSRRKRSFRYFDYYLVLSVRLRQDSNPMSSVSNDYHMTLTCSPNPTRPRPELLS